MNRKLRKRKTGDDQSSKFKYETEVYKSGIKVNQKRRFNKKKLHLKLYIAGKSPNSEEAIRNIKNLHAMLRNKVQIEIIDVFKHPEKAWEENIFVFPALVKKSPEPVSIILGDLSDRETLFELLGLKGEN